MECCITSFTLSHTDQKGTRGHRTANPPWERVHCPGPASLPSEPSLCRGYHPASHSLSHPSPGLVTEPANQSQRKRWLYRDMACTQPSLSAPKRFCSPEELGEESRWAEKQLVSPSSRQMLGTVRINGLEIQVRAIQKLPDYSKYRSLRRKRLIEVQNWKRGNPGNGGRVSGERLLYKEALDCL